jgi:hypothetical protein
MNIGLLWEYNADKKNKNFNLLEEIHKAFDYYYTKMDHYPDTCYLNTDVEETLDGILDFDGHKVAVGRYRWVLKKHLIIGNEADDINESE